jgi:hypothetical protein
MTERGGSERRFDLLVQIGNGVPASTGEKMSKEEFIRIHPNYETGVSTACEPPLYHLHAAVGPNLRYWLSWKEGSEGEVNWNHLRVEEERIDAYAYRRRMTVTNSMVGEVVQGEAVAATVYDASDVGKAMAASVRMLEILNLVLPTLDGIRENPMRVFAPSTMGAISDAADRIRGTIASVGTMDGVVSSFVPPFVLTHWEGDEEREEEFPGIVDAQKRAMALREENFSVDLTDAEGNPVMDL